jgi:L-alanine-DL-glutamate epimerase-like enolase superfamily enzyme
MKLSRRTVLAGALATGGAVAYQAGSQKKNGGPRRPSRQELHRAALAPVLKRDGLKSPVIIDSLRLLKKDDEYFVHVRSKDGAEGIAVTNPRPEYLDRILKQVVFPFFIGKDARDLDRLLWDFYREDSNYKLQGLAMWCPHAWTEFAILDMLGRVAGKSMGALLGDVVRQEVPIYVASGRRDTTPEQEVEFLAGLLQQSGAKALKMRLGGRMSRNADALPGRTEGLIRLSRKTFGDGIDIHGDANSSYDDPQQAIKIGRMLEEIKAVYYEEPCEFDDLEGTKIVRDALTIPVAGGEQEASEWRFRWMIEHGGVDIVQPDLQYYGGMIRSLRVARMADLASMPTTVHISGGFGFVYMLHFASVIRDPGKYQEYKLGTEKYGNWFDPAIQVKDGKMSIPKGPGVGIKDIAAVLKGAKEV